MMAPQQHAQPQNSVSQPKRQARFAGRLSPQQSLKRAMPVISEALRTNLRSRPREGAPNGSQQNVFRPKSGADAYLCLDQRLGTDSCIRAFEPDSRSQKPLVDLPRSATPAKKTVLPIGSSMDSRQVQSDAETAPGRKTAVQFAGSRIQRPCMATPVKSNDKCETATRVRLPGLVLNRQVNTQRRRRLSKALPALPPPSPSPCPTSFKEPRQHTPDTFQNNRSRVLQGRGSTGTKPLAAPPMETHSGNSESSSGSSYDSAEHTWNAINSMMAAIGEDEVKRARESLIPPNTRAPSAYVTFPRMKASRMDGEVSSDGYSSTVSGRTISGSSYTDSSSSHYPSQTFPRRRSPIQSIKRRASETSIFSIVIQPTRERSRETQEALIGEDDIPSRIKGILQCTHLKPDLSMSSRTSSASSDEAGLHPDLALTIDALRSVSDVELDDIRFDS
ncbi:uncharacterized protein FOMMEDRAFT_28662 [Fomitiporia mediterranea MF3/22]|uniref:uncharacterized protein n=1 Tax=Fomitiporia mediterranea (strain MF3/22) TaxID=694068 RepID=UPI0004407516|nr:uncharacterized protein FOMMEDRAFT_28662 [Fomitiporia mediterranea MF3/22]EJD03073.1 hypothetical protein FOMMEDRAFT_28662 [Fomitiporia mediterranea MF3/22]